MKRLDHCTIDIEFFGSVKGIIFDCDGVLIDSRDANMLYYNRIRQGLGLLPMTPEEEDFVHAHSVEQSVRHIIPLDRYAEAEEVRRHMDYADLVEAIYLHEGLTELLESLKASGVKLAVNTNRTDTMGLILERFGLEGFFHPVMTAGDVDHPKPNPQGAHRILRTWGLSGREVVFVGDSAIDEQTAKAAGVRFWAYRNPALKAELHVDDYSLLQGCVLRSLQA